MKPALWRHSYNNLPLYNNYNNRINLTMGGRGERKGGREGKRERERKGETKSVGGGFVREQRGVKGNKQQHAHWKQKWRPKRTAEGTEGGGGKRRKRRRRWRSRRRRRRRRRKRGETRYKF